MALEYASMKEHKQSISPEKNVELDGVPAQKERWQPPTLESLDMADSEAMVGTGGDGAPTGSTLS